MLGATPEELAAIRQIVSEELGIGADAAAAGQKKAEEVKALLGKPPSGYVLVHYNSTEEAVAAAVNSGVRHFVALADQLVVEFNFVSASGWDFPSLKAVARAERYSARGVVAKAAARAAAEAPWLDKRHTEYLASLARS